MTIGIEKSDPFCEVLVGFDCEPKTTSTIRNNLNPVWNQSFDFEVKELQAEQILVVCKIFDRDYLQRNDKLGFVAISLSVLKLKQNEPFDMWLPLQGIQHGSLHIKITALNFSINGLIDSGNLTLIPQVDLRNILNDYKNSRGTVSFKPRGRSLMSILNGTISDEESNRLDKLFGVAYVHELYDKLRTGDIILSSGRISFSKTIELAYGSTWSHISMIIRNPDMNLLLHYGVNHDVASDPSSCVYVVESETDTLDNREGGGVQIVEFRQWVNHVLSEGKNELFVVRHLKFHESSKDEKMEHQFPNLANHLIQVRFRQFEVHPLELLKVIFKKNKKKDETSLFCSEFVASCLVQMGLIPPNTLTNNYGPKDFSSETNNINTVLLWGASYSDEVRIKKKEDACP